MGQDGLRSRLTSTGLPVLRVHYSADARKDPRTTAGLAWLEQAQQGYPLGLRDPGWRKEMEIEYGALGGQILFALWESYKPFVVIPPITSLDQLPFAKLYGSYDHGWIHPSVYHVHAVCPGGRKVTLWEFAGSQVPLRAIADIIKGRDVKLHSDGRYFAGNPYAGKEIVRVADPSIFERRGKMNDVDPHASVGDVLRDKYQVTMQKGKKGGDLTVASWLIGDLWLDPEAPTYQIVSTCTQLLYELPRLRHKQLSPHLALRSAAPEQIIDKDNDAWDSMKLFLRLFPSTVAPRPPKSIAGTFAHAQALARRRPLRGTYQRR